MLLCVHFFLKLIKQSSGVHKVFRLILTQYRATLNIILYKFWFCTHILYVLHRNYHFLAVPVYIWKVFVLNWVHILVKSIAFR